jgi:hypothetical protein
MTLSMSFGIAFEIAGLGQIRHLYEPFIALAQHTGQRQRGFVVHDIGYHRSAVEIGLHAFAAESLR